VIPSVAREASYVLFSIRKFAVDFARHGYHMARNYLVLIFVAGKITFHMARVAFAAKSDGERSHRVVHFFRLQDLQILWRGTRRLRLILSE
jgi:hypothetical protein